MPLLLLMASQAAREGFRDNANWHVAPQTARDVTEPQQPRLVDQGAGQRDALLLAA